jgi:DNA-binding response OmpR family regulator
VHQSGPAFFVLGCSLENASEIMNILVVDDDPRLRFLLQGTLATLGHSVTLANDGIEGLTAFQTCHVPLIISDRLMPGMDGLELCRRIRKAERSQYTYFILLTAVEGKSSYLDGMNAGADDFITKPFDRDVLAARIAVAQRILKLQSEVKQLAGLLPICALCKKIRDDQNYWHQVESFIARRTDATFTHSYCPDCFKKLLNEIEGVTSAQAKNRSPC